MPEHQLKVLDYRPFNPNDPTGENWKILRDGLEQLTTPPNESVAPDYEEIPLGIYFVPSWGFFDLEGYSKGSVFYHKWNTRWSEFPQKTEDEHLDIVKDQIPF